MHISSSIVKFSASLDETRSVNKQSLLDIPPQAETETYRRMDIQMDRHYENSIPRHKHSLLVWRGYCFSLLEIVVVGLWDGEG